MEQTVVMSTLDWTGRMEVSSVCWNDKFEVHHSKNSVKSPKRSPISVMLQQMAHGFQIRLGFEISFLGVSIPAQPGTCDVQLATVGQSFLQLSQGLFKLTWDITDHGFRNSHSPSRNSTHHLTGLWSHIRPPCSPYYSTGETPAQQQHRRLSHIKTVCFMSPVNNDKVIIHHGYSSN